MMMMNECTAAVAAYVEAADVGYVAVPRLSTLSTLCGSVFHGVSFHTQLAAWCRTLAVAVSTLCTAPTLGWYY
jgi:hypothetical protein